MRFANTRGCAPSTTVESNGGRSRSFGNAGTLLPRDLEHRATRAFTPGKEAKMSRIDNHRRREFLKGSVAAAIAASSWGWHNRSE